MGEVKKEKKVKVKKERSKTSIWIENIIEIIIMVVCITFSIITISNPGGLTKDHSKINVSYMPVLSESMSGTFEKGDLIFGDKIKKDSNGNNEILDIGDVAIFIVNDPAISKYQFINTHRIVGYYYTYFINENGKDTPIEGYADMLKNDSVTNAETAYKFAESKGWSDFSIKGYVTSGDNKSIYYKDGNEKGELLDPNNTDLIDNYFPSTTGVLGKWNGKKISGLGGVITWIKEPTHFFFVVLLPLAILFLFNIWTIIKYVIDIKTEKAKKLALEEAQTSGASPVLDEEEIKRRAVEEYKKQLEAEKASNDSKEDK